MDLTRLEEPLEDVDISQANPRFELDSALVSLEAEIPEPLYNGMKEFINSNPQWDQYRVMGSALANFLFQNGCEDRAVVDRYLQDLFSRVEI